MDNTLYKSAYNVCHIILADIKKQRKVTTEDIQSAVDDALTIKHYSLLDRESLIAQLEADMGVWTRKATELVNTDVKPWLTAKKAEINWELWERYRTWKSVDDASFPIDNLDDLTDKILDKCFNPKVEGSWDRRGMVVGNVQSGKTANYTGLINKATDAGYKLIIVIAGIHNTLRSQTQARIDEGYIGRNSADFIRDRSTKQIGVGRFKAETEIYSYTSSEERGDFNRRIASLLNVPIGGGNPTVLVVKKNKSILENLIIWLHQFASENEEGPKIVDVPLLVIDDEADNASVNSGNEIDVKTINRLIRTLLNLFSKNTFIGYTATPYANLFIPSTWNEELQTMVGDLPLRVGEDLFPRDFIINIPPPSNYIGAAKVFGFENEKTGESNEGLDIIRFVEDQEPYFPKKINRENRDDLPEDVPVSLREAIKSFILTCAIRRLRGQAKAHNSMLVHVAMRVAWIDRVAWLVNEIVRDYKRQIKSGQGELLEQLKTLFEEDFVPTTLEVKENLGYTDPRIKHHTWAEVEKELYNASAQIEVRAVHGTRNTRHLEYHEIEDINYRKYKDADIALSVIAVGGNRLARGITLEGLSVSYYLRTTRLYDSLMQMGRWFGYRPGYADLCRLYTTDELVGWYRHVTMATEEMRADFDEMAANDMRPEHYRLKVRTHPGMLAITSLAKMREHERIQVGFSGKLEQTYAFSRSLSVIHQNYKAFTYLLSRLSNPEILQTKSGTNGLLWDNVDADFVIRFISDVQYEYIRNEVLIGYIKAQLKKEKLNRWAVAVQLNSGKTITATGTLKGKEVSMFDISWKDGVVTAGLPVRGLDDKGKELRVKGRANAILDKRARTIDLGIKGDPSEDKIKELRSRKGQPLLVILPLDPRVANDDAVDIPVIGFGLAFPEFEGEETYEYAARPVNDDFEEASQEDDDIDTDE